MNRNILLVATTGATLALLKQMREQRIPFISMDGEVISSRELIVSEERFNNIVSGIGVFETSFFVRERDLELVILMAPGPATLL